MTESLIKIGNEIDEETCKYLSEFVEKVFKIGRETQMDQSTIVKALDLFKSAALAAPQVNISNSNFESNDIHKNEEN